MGELQDISTGVFCVKQKRARTEGQEIVQQQAAIQMDLLPDKK